MLSLGTQGSDLALTNIDLKRFIVQKGINDRKLAIENLIRIYKDDWEDIIRQEIARQFTPDSQVKLRPLITREMNIIKRVTNETALVYKNNAVRKALIADGVDEAGDDKFKEDENYEKIINNTTINSQMKQVNKFTKLTNQTMLRVLWRNKRIDFDLLTFDNVEIFTDPEDWTKIIAIKYFIDLELAKTTPDFGDDNVVGTNDVFLTAGSDTSFGVPIDEIETPVFSTMFLWTLEDKDPVSKEYKESFVRTFKQIKGEMVEVEKKENPYKQDGFPVLPFVFFPNKFPHDNLTDYTTGNDMFDGNMNVALNYIHLNELIKFQSYKQIWAKARDASAFPKVWDLDAQSVLTLTDEDNSTEVGTLDLQTDITKIFDVIISRIIMMFGSVGIPPSAVRIEGNGPESGIKIRLDKQTLFEFREDDIQIYADKEKQLFNLTRIVNNFHNPAQPISEEAELGIDFAEITFPSSRQESAAADSIELQNNTITGPQILQRKNPDLTEDQANQLYQENKEVNANSLGGLAPVGQPSNAEEGNNA